MARWGKFTSAMTLTLALTFDEVGVVVLWLELTSLVWRTTHNLRAGGSRGTRCF